MPSAYRIKRYEYITLTKRTRLLEENLVPILDDASENDLDVQSYLQDGDWLIEYRDKNKPIYLYRVRTYRHRPRLHLYIKHFAEVDAMYKLDSSFITDDYHNMLGEAKYLEALPPSILDVVNEYHDRLAYDFDEKLNQLIFKLKTLRNVLTPIGKVILTGIENGGLEPNWIKDKVLMDVKPDIIKVVREKMPEKTDAEWEKDVLPKLYNLQWEEREKMLFDTESKSKPNNKNDDERTGRYINK